MEQFIFDENNGLWYERQGDYNITCLTVQTDEEKPIGLRGRRHLHSPAAVLVRPAAC